MKKKMLISFCTAMLMVLCLFPTVSYAADVTIDLKDYADGSVINIAAGDNATIQDTAVPATTHHNIQIICGAGVNVALKGVTIDNTGTASCPLSFTGGGNTLKTVIGTVNSLTAGTDEPAVRVESGTELTIGDVGTLEATGSSYGAGIGGGNKKDCGTISITNGHVNAEGSYGAGIGGGNEGNGGTINITVAPVTASSISGAGIGGGAGASGGTINITGGTVTASNSGEGAGIGGGAGGSGGTINLSYGTVTGEGNAGAGIGGGLGGSGGIINISSGTVTGKSTGGAGIGGGSSGGAGGDINITGGTVTATGSSGGAGIGGGTSGAGGDLSIMGGTVTATGNGGAGIGGGTGGAGGTVSITGGIVAATGNSGGTGIGGGNSGAGGAMSITGGIVTANGNGIGFDIGGAAGAGGTLSADGAAGVTLAGSGTNAAVTLGTCGITGAGAGSLAGVYISGERYTSGSVIDVSGTSSGTGYTYSSPVFTINTSGEYLIWNGTQANRIVVASGVNADIILFGTYIQPASGCAFDMTGATVDMTLMGSSILKSGLGYTCLLCPLGSTLSISGSGSLNAVARSNSGGGAGSGVGGNYSTACGSITINSGTVTAAGGNTRGGKIGLAGIGGAVVNITGGTVNAFSYKSGSAIGYYSNAGSTVTINGGTVTATAGINNYGIGGKGADAPNITISGGNVTATGDSAFPAIGGTGGTLTISGGTVYASSRFGSGIAVYSGTTNISGGAVYAASGDPAQYKDIGTTTGFEGTLTISGEAMVFLKNNSSDTPVTAHKNETFPAGTSEVYGAAISIPDTWTSGFGAYIKPYTLSFSANGGSGTVPAVMRLYGIKTGVPDGSSLTRSNYTFGGWNTAPDGSGTRYAPGDKFTVTANTTLYAYWTAKPALTSSDDDAKIYEGGRIELKPNISGGTWNWDKTFFSKTSDSPVTFKALKSGTSTITYTVDGQTVSYTVTVEKSSLPLTGQDASWMWALGVLGVLSAVGVVFLKKRSLNQN